MEQITVLRNESKSLDHVKCTIGICAYNEQSNIGLLLRNLIKNQDLETDAQILVVCSGCTDLTPDVVRHFCLKDNRVELILQKERFGKASAVNEILKRASHDVIFFVDADVVPSSHSLKILFKEFSDPQIGAACGSPNPLNGKASFFRHLNNLVWRMHNRTLKMLNDLKINTHTSGQLMAIRRGLIKVIPDDTINDDAYIALEIARTHRVKYCESAKVHFRAPANVADYVRQRRRIMVGHHSVRRATGRYPRTLGAMSYYDFKQLTKILRDEINYHSSDVPKLGLAITLEIVANGLAWVDVMLRKRHIAWTVATSTKTLLGGTTGGNLYSLLHSHNGNDIKAHAKPQ